MKQFQPVLCLTKTVKVETSHCNFVLLLSDCSTMYLFKYHFALCIALCIFLFV